MKKLSILMFTIPLSFTACSNVTFTGGSSSETCPVGNYSDVEVKKIKQDKFAGISDPDVNDFALALLPCVGSPNPDIRDGLVYESLSYLLRNEKLTDDTKSGLFTSILEMLNGAEDKAGFVKPFAALDMSELARADRVKPYLSAEQRAGLVAATADYLAEITDYRGYDDKDGWRHGVAHASDIVLQLTLNENISDSQLAALRKAVGTQIAPESGHAYVHGESERLARPIMYMARRGTFSQEDWDSWFATLCEPEPFETWADIFKSEAGLAKLHNTKAFLNTIYINASVSANENVKMLENSALAQMKNLP